MTDPKICIFTETYYPVMGGGETQATLLAESLAVNGFSVIVLTRRSDPLLKKIDQIGSISVYRLPPVGEGHLKKWGLLFTCLPTLIKLRKKYDLIFVSGFRVVGFIAVLFSRTLGKLCILKADSLGEMSGMFFVDGLAKLRLSPSTGVVKLFLRARNRILKHADCFIAISTDVKRELLSCGIPSERMVELPNCVDTIKFSPVHKTKKSQIRQKLNLPLKDKIVIYTGRLVTYKGLPLLLRVWHQIHHNNKKLKLLLVGAGGLDIHNCESEIKNFVRKHELRNSVCFTGAVDNVHEYLQASDIFVFPTEREAFGISLIEAMACGLAVVSTPVGGIKDILRHRYNGLIVNPGDFQQLSDAITVLLNDPLLSARLGKASRQTVESRYSAEVVTRRYINLFKNVSYSKIKG